MRRGGPTRELFRVLGMSTTNSDRVEPTAPTLCDALLRREPASAAICRGEPARGPLRALDINTMIRNRPFGPALHLEELA